MANVSATVLKIDRVTVGANVMADVTVEYNIDYSSYDRSSNQPYSVVCQLIGDDSGDGVDDVIANGQLGGSVTVASGGQTTLHRTHTKRFALSQLDEDAGINADEIRALITLTPLMPRTRVVESNQVVITNP